MRNKLLAIASILALMIGLQSCSNDDDNNNPDSPASTAPTVDQKYVDTFKEKFPTIDAGNVKWEQKQSYFVAEFSRLPQTETDAWFNSNAQWVMTKDDLGKDLFLIPTAVNQAFNKYQFSANRIDDIEHYTTESLDYYIIEVEQSGTADMQLYYKPDGTLIKSITDDGREIYPDTPL